MSYSIRCIAVNVFVAMLLSSLVTEVSGVATETANVVPVHDALSAVVLSHDGGQLVMVTLNYIHIK